VVIELLGSPDGSVDVDLLSLDGRSWQPAGTPAVTGSHVEFSLPALEPGTYLLTWRYEASGESRQGASSFSIGKPSADALDTGERGVPAIPAGVPAGLLAAAGIVVAASLAARRRGVRRAVLVAAAGTAAVAAVTLSSGVWWAAGLAAAGAVVAATLGAWARGGRMGTLLAAGLLGVAAGAVIGLSGSGALGPVAGAAVSAVAVSGMVVTAGVTVVVLVSWPRGRALLRTGRQGWAVLLLTGSLLPVGTWVNGGGTLVVVAASVLAGGMLLGAGAAAFGLHLNRSGLGRAGAVAALACTVVGLVALTPPAAQPRLVPLASDTAVSAAACAADPNRLQATACLQAKYGAMVRSDGVTAALEDLRSQVAASPQLRFYCHETSHAIGRAAMAVTGTLEGAFAAGFDVCDFGYYHGIVEGAAGQMSDAEFEQAVPSLCRELATSNQLFFMQCTHGLGHAAARRANNDLVRGLEFCDALAGDRQMDARMLEGALSACGTGVTMEWFATAGANGGADGQAVTPEVSELRDACQVVPANWLGACTEYVGNTVDTTRPLESLQEIAAWCLTQDGAVRECFNGVARAAAGTYLPIADAIGLCDMAAGARESCLEFYIVLLATTIEYDVSAVERVCGLLPDADRSGPDSVCSRIRPVVGQVLSTSDGKAASSRE
jgi:hypothetical protein